MKLRFASISPRPVVVPSCGNEHAPGDWFYLIIFLDSWI